MKYIILLLILINGCVRHYTIEEVKYGYDSGSYNKALAIGSNNIYGTAWNVPTIEQAKQIALESCIRGRGINCKIVSVNGIEASNSKQHQNSYKPTKEIDIKSNNKKNNKFYNFVATTMLYLYVMLLKSASMD